MKNKGQTEDVFADLIPSLILIVVGGFVLYYFSAEFSGEIRDNEEVMRQLEDREGFSIEGMMRHQMEVDGKKYSLLEIIEKYNKEGKFATDLSMGVEDYLNKIEPKISSCFKINLKTEQQKELELANTCGLTYVWTENKESEEALLPTYGGGYAKITIEHEEPKL